MSNRFLILTLKKKLNNVFFNFFFSYSEDLNSLCFFNVEKNFFYFNDIFLFPFSKVFFLDANSFFFLSKSSSFKTISFFKNKIFLLLKGYINGFFIEFRIFGLGFKIKKIMFIEKKSILIDLGFSHFFKLIVPFNFKVFRAKRRFFFFTNDFYFFKIFLDFFKRFRILSRYKLRGFKIAKSSLKLKAVKKQKRK